MSARAGFEATYGQLDEIVDWLTGDGVALSHGELEDQLAMKGRELLRCALQDHLVGLAEAEQRVEVIDADGVERATVEPGHTRLLGSVFGEVTVTRRAYRQRGGANLCPLDAVLNLPVERHSHGLRRLSAAESSRGSFEEAVDAIERACGQRVGKRQVEQLAVAAAVDFAGECQKLCIRGSWWLVLLDQYSTLVKLKLTRGRGRRSRTGAVLGPSSGWGRSTSSRRCRGRATAA